MGLENEGTQVLNLQVTQNEGGLHHQQGDSLARSCSGDSLSGASLCRPGVPKVYRAWFYRFSATSTVIYKLICKMAVLPKMAGLPNKSNYYKMTAQKMISQHNALFKSGLKASRSLVEIPSGNAMETSWCFSAVSIGYAGMFRRFRRQLASLDKYALKLLFWAQRRPQQALDSTADLGALVDMSKRYDERLSSLIWPVRAFKKLD